MTRGARAALLMALCAALPACEGGERAAPPPITGNEEQAVADAAEMLGERVPAANSLEDSEAADTARSAQADSND